MQTCICCTDWSQFKTKYREHIRYIKYNYPVSLYTMQFTKLHECDPLILLCHFFIMLIRIFI